MEEALENTIINEVDYWKKKCEVLEKDLFKARTQNKKHEVDMKKLQDKLSVFGKNSNNTSNTFLLPSEFKVQWDQLVKDSVMEAFDLCSDSAELLALLVQTSMEIIFQLSSNLLADTIIRLLENMNIETDKKSANTKRLSTTKVFLPKLRNFF
eukprot:CAMPEP_0170530854 /NCGR_PEP_ID=MMETSP0209-20121228/54764_1 /TAXON_ID=665100 ORGANISM="Litonotus pictus, Strain P1" /NCGR_SAMPLE_ID=MMETSP0209 /ASSEMBLY_ACC=CAM_ASM_000301 /LENGTH=152 /DNA_ID=CAMNT_0010824625 /DNA_START=30 /DNA_END=485 /DNA_ORIENTATION=-